jgi:hypothetical protein
MSVYTAISRLVHQHDFLPIELLCYVITGTSGAEDVSHSYSDASWSARHREYDDMTPEDVRATARAARQHHQQHAQTDDICRAFAIIAAEGSGVRSRLEGTLLQAAERTRKRRLDALEGDEVPEQQNAGVYNHGVANDADDGAPGDEDVDTDFLEFMGV